MAIDISNRPPGGMRKVTLKGGQNHGQKGLSYKALFAVALGAALLNAAAMALSAVSFLPLLVSRSIGKAEVFIICFLTAKLYKYSENRRLSGLVLAIGAVVSHFPCYLYLSAFGLNRGSFFSTTSLMFPLLMGYSALCICDMKSLDCNVKNVVIFLTCIAAVWGDGGSLAAVWVFIFGSEYSDRAKINYACIAGLVMFVIELILGFTSGGWLTSFGSLGFLLAVPIVSRYRATDRRAGKKVFLYALCPVIYLLYYAVYSVLLHTLWAAMN